VIKLTVQSYNGAPLPQALSAQFDELGGTIGRADNNQLVLPDPERSISRVHAQVSYRNGTYVLVDRGSNAVIVNGRPLGNGAESPLAAGDQVQIGGYLIRVDAMTAAMAGSGGAGASSDPFGDLGGMAFAAPAGPATPPRAPQAAFAHGPTACRLGRPHGRVRVFVGARACREGSLRVWRERPVGQPGQPRWFRRRQFWRRQCAACGWWHP
jgi:FHA domain-containing protein